MAYVDLANRVYNGPSYMDLGAPSGVVWDARLDLLPLSTTANASELRAALTAMGLTLTRASSATVQTSASEVVTSGIGVDDPRVGLYGLVIEESRQCINPRSTAVTTAPWGKVQGTETFASDDATAPDGSVDGDRILTTTTTDSGTFYNYTSFTTQSYAFSTWAKSRTGSAQNYRFRMPNICGTSNQYSSAASAGTAWSRGSYVAAVTVGTGNSSALIVNPAGVAIDVNAWGAQLEAGKFPTELILTTGAAATRAAESLTLNDVGRILRNGRVSIECRYTPKHSTADMNAGGNMLFSQPGLFTRAYMNAAGAFIMRHQGAASITSSNTFTYSALDVLDVYFEIGGGVAPYAAIRKNGGARTVYVFPAGTYGNVVASTVPTLFSEGGSVAPCSAWVQRIRAYAPGRRPSWAS